jgi:deoxyribonuclease IV
MKKDKIILGSYVKMNKETSLKGLVKEANKYGANAFMFYLGSPQNSYRKNFNSQEIKEFHEELKKEKISLNNVIVHAPYIINLGNYINKRISEFTFQFLKKEIEMCEKIGIKIIVIHPGSYPVDNSKQALKYVAENINKILTPQSKIKIAIETMSGKGKQIGINFDQIDYILKKIKLNQKVGVCWDTCHLHDYGFDVEKIEDLIKEFENKIGLKKLFVIHLNDSKSKKGEKKDKHENIGHGYIGFENILNFVFHPKLSKVTKILETPYIENKPVYKEEIKMILEKKFFQLK